LKPGFETLERYKSPSIPSKVHAVGKYAKKEGCCQCVIPSEGRLGHGGQRNKTKNLTWHNKFLVVICNDLEILSFLRRGCCDLVRGRVKNRSSGKIHLRYAVLGIQVLHREAHAYLE